MSEQSIFLAALDISDPAERAAYLTASCAGNEALREEIEALLAAHARSGPFLDEPAVAQMVDPGAVETRTAVPGIDPDFAEIRAVGTGSGNSDQDALAFLQPPARAGSLGRLAHYEVEEVLGRGGFGTVLRAFDDRLHRVVAIKLMAPQLAASGAARARFLREGRSAAAVRDEHVVNVHAVSDGNETIPYLVMEFVAGQTLQQKLDKVGPLPVAEVLRIGSQIARGLAAAHATGLIHRDIKPANILLENGVERVKITDFGLARAVDDASLSQSGVVAGTPQYMAPEQARGDSIDHRADLFSLGSVLYTMCTGRPPFRAETALAVLKRVCEEEPRPVREVNPQVPQWLAHVVAKLHAKNPADRFQSAREVADLLARYLSELQLRGTVQSHPAVRSAVPARTRRRLCALVALVFLLPLAVWAGYAMTRPHPDPGDERAQLAINWEERDLVVMVFGDDGVNYLSEGATKGTGMQLKPGTYTVRAQRGGEVVFERKVTLGPRQHRGIDIPPAAVKAPKPQREPPLAVAPFDAARAKELQEKWAKYLGVPVEYENPAGVKLRLIPPGEFSMGSSKEEIDYLLTQAPDFKDAEGWLKDYVRKEGPVRKVTIREPLLLGTYEVTVGQFREFVQATGYKTDAEKGGGGVLWDTDVRKWKRDPEAVWSNPKYSSGENHPVAFTTPADANAFCEWLSRKDGLTYMLPTEEQWEYACRAGTTTRWYSGDDAALVKDHGWTLENSGAKLKPVGQKRPNPFGLYDVIGNVAEMTFSSQGELYERGGQVHDTALRARSAWRNPILKPAETHGRRGFRVAVVGNLRAKPPARQTPNLNVLQPLRDAVAAKGRVVAEVKLRFEAGKVSKLDLLAVQVELREANIKLAEAEGDLPILILHLRELVKLREAERELIGLRVEVGADRRSALDDADARLAEAKARLAKVRPPEVAPPPRPKS